MAADEKTGEADILFSQLSGNAEGRISPGEIFVFRFLFAYNEYPSPACRCQGGSLIIIGRKCNSKTYNALRLLPKYRKARGSGASSNRFSESELLL
jgi:hypothetical protein